MSATGTWTVTMKTPMGAQPATFELAEDGGAITGTVSTPMVPTPMEISEGTADGSDLAWKVAMTSPMPMTLEFTGNVDGDAISGSVTLGSFGSGTFEGGR